MVFESLGSAGNYSTLLRIVDLSVSKVENVMRIKEMDTDGKNIIPKNFDIEVENVDFYYDENHAEDAKIINHLSVHIPERTTTAIVGPSGGGKTTFVSSDFKILGRKQWKYQSWWRKCKELQCG